MGVTMFSLAEDTHTHTQNPVFLLLLHVVTLSLSSRAGSFLPFGFHSNAVIGVWVTGPCVLRAHLQSLLLVFAASRPQGSNSISPSDLP